MDGQTKISVYKLSLSLILGDGDDETVIGETEDKLVKSTPSKGDRSHLIVWQVSCPK